MQLNRHEEKTNYRPLGNSIIDTTDRFIDNTQVVIYAAPAASKNHRREISPIADHEFASFAAVAAHIAALGGLRYEGEYDPARNYEAYEESNKRNTRASYFVPIDTLLLTQANALGIHDESQLFGGCVPYPFVGTKSITHGLISTDAAAPTGWCQPFADSVATVVLPGYSAFSKKDALAAAEQLLLRGQIRIKAPLGRGGAGQCVAADNRQVRAALEMIDDDDCARCGIVIEQNLTHVSTRSIGTVTIGNRQISYYGTQYLISNARGHSVYGGSTLRAIRGDFTALLQCNLSAMEQLAVAQANVYDTAARRHFPDFFASRRNYDVAQGMGPDHTPRSGVLEQSWRIGGASPAEITAFEALLHDENLFSVHASCREIYSLCEAPPHARIYFRGEDARAGAITKFSTIDAREYLTA